MVLDRISHLSLHCSVTEFLSQKESHLVVFGGLLKLSEEDMSVAEVTVRPPLCTSVTELLSNLQSLLVVVDGFGEVSKQIMNIPEVTTGPTLSCSIL